MIRGENFPPPLSQNSILGKKRGGAPQIRQKFNQLGFISNTNIKLRLVNFLAPSLSEEKKNWLNVLSKYERLCLTTQDLKSLVQIKPKLKSEILFLI